MNLRRCEAFILLLCLLLAIGIPLLAQRGFEHPVEVEHPVEKVPEQAKEAEKSASEKAVDEAFEKQRNAYEEEWKFHDRYSKVDREYYGWLSSGEFKKPFNQLVDDAIVSIRHFSNQKVFKNAGNQQIVEALSSQSQALPPPNRLNLQLRPQWFGSDTLEVSKPGSSASTSVNMNSLKDYISEAIDKERYPPLAPGEIIMEVKAPVMPESAGDIKMHLPSHHLQTGEKGKVAPQPAADNTAPLIHAKP